MRSIRRTSLLIKSVSYFLAFYVFLGIRETVYNVESIESQYNFYSSEYAYSDLRAERMHNFIKATSVSRSNNAFSNLAPPLTVNSSEFLVLTYGSNFFFPRIINLIGSLAVWEPTMPVVVFDLGFEAKQLQFLARLRNVIEIRKFDFSMYPEHVKTLKNYAWKPIIIKDIVDSFPEKYVIVQDSGQELRQPIKDIKANMMNHNHYFIRQKRSYTFVPQSKCNGNTICLSLFEEMPENELLKKITFVKVAGGVNGFKFGTSIYDKILIPVYRCAMNVDCTQILDDQTAFSIRRQIQNATYFKSIVYFTDWREPWYLTKDEMKTNDIVLYSRKFQTPGPYTKHLQYRNSSIHIQNTKGDILSQERDSRGETPNFQYSNEISNRYFSAELNEFYSSGERVFLIGNGPSLSSMPLYLLENEYTITFNRFDLFLDRIHWDPTFFMCIDSLVCPDIAQEILENKNHYRHIFIPSRYVDKKVDVNYTSFFPSSERRIHWMQFIQKLGEPIIPRDNNQYQLRERGTVAAAGLEMLVYMGFKEIYLIGVDMTYSKHAAEEISATRAEDLISIENTDMNHFDPRYFGKGKKFHDPRVDAYMLPSFMRAIHKIKSDDPTVNIYNAGYGGRLPDSQISRVDFLSLFPEKKSTYFFLHTLEASGVFIDYHQTELTNQVTGAVKIYNSSQYVNHTSIFVADESISIQHMKIWVLNHIPRGPCAGEYVFFLRSMYQNQFLSRTSNV